MVAFPPPVSQPAITCSGSNPPCGPIWSAFGLWSQAASFGAYAEGLLSEEWRCGVLEEVATFRKKPQLALEMLI